MSRRKTPVLLRQGPLSGAVFVLTRYTQIEQDDGRTITQAAADGKHDVTAEYAWLTMERLCGEDTDMIAVLDKIARDEEEVTDEDRAKVGRLAERLQVLLDVMTESQGDDDEYTPTVA